MICFYFQTNLFNSLINHSVFHDPSLIALLFIVKPFVSVAGLSKPGF